ncbi:MAG: molybdenum cofactor guanylyltransferase [Acidimicrobiales bacterium]
MQGEPTPAYRPIVGAVLCGGRSSRFGSDKALADAGGRLLGQTVVDALREALVDPVVAIGGSAGPTLGLPTVPDLRPGDGPLGGLATALLWAKTGPVVVVPCDLVLLQAAHIEAVVAAARRHEGHVVVATVLGEPQVSLACWPAERGREVLKLLDAGKRRFYDALDQPEWVGVELPADAISDADTPEDLERILNRPAG